MVEFGHGQGAVSNFRTTDVRTSQNKTFASLQLKPWLRKNLKAANYIWQSRIQEECLPAVLTGNDIIIQSKSGTGKTLVFTISILERIREDIDKLQALVLAPTREIALQAYNTINKVGKDQVKATLIIGGTSLVQNKREVRKKRPQVIVGTPGRILDLYSRGDILASTVEMLILDEADELLQSETFRVQVSNIRDALSFERLQTICLSATFPSSLKTFMENFLRPDPLVIKSKRTQLDGIGISSYRIMENETVTKRAEVKLRLLLQILESVNFNQCIIFAHNHGTAHRASVFLNAKGWPNTLLSGRLDQNCRTQAWEQLVTKETSILVCTDLGARGIDSAHADLVINIEMCHSSEVMTHRIGRAGRFGSRGESIFLTSEDEEKQLHEMVTKMKLKLHEYENFKILLNDCKDKLQISQTMKEKEKDFITKNTFSDSDTEIESFNLARCGESDGFNSPHTPNLPKPHIPPLWEILNVPGPPQAVYRITEARDIANETAIIEAEVAKIEAEDSHIHSKHTKQFDFTENLDGLTDEGFKVWRKYNPRPSEQFMCQYESSFDPKTPEDEIRAQLESEYFVNSILASDDEKTCIEESSKSGDCYDYDTAPSTSSGRPSFMTLYDELFLKWMSLNR